MGDTAVEMDPQDADNPWRRLTRQLMQQVCTPLQRGNITKEQARQRLVQMGIDSCPDQPGSVDNVLNYMSYSPDACQCELTPQQIQRMQSSTRSHRPQLYSNSLVA